MGLQLYSLSAKLNKISCQYDIVLLALDINYRDSVPIFLSSKSNLRRSFLPFLLPLF